MVYNLFQEHTVRLYNLENHPFEVLKVKARSLLSVLRFDLFAKLYYARHRDQKFELAKEVYLKHIKAFNPDGKEPGRSDKASYEDFLQVFDDLLDYFKDKEFDATQSVVPVSSNGTILDGAHRVAALAYYDKEITIAKFENVVPVCQFDYNYFKQRGLSQHISDMIAHELLYWIPDCFVACLWPRMGTPSQKEQTRSLLQNYVVPFYHKSFEVNLRTLTLFITKVYQMQPWVGSELNQYAGAKDKALNCYAKGNNLDLYFFTTSRSLQEILEVKEQIRNLYPYGKHSIHITDNNDETRDIAFFTLCQQGLSQWFYSGNWVGWRLVKQNIMERIYIFQHTYWIDFKVFVASFINKIRDRKI